MSCGCHLIGGDGGRCNGIERGAMVGGVRNDIELLK